MKVPETIDFKASDLIPLFGIRSEENRFLLNRLMMTGMMIGGITGFIAGATGWGRPFYYAFFYALSVETYTLMLALKVVRKRHGETVNVWLLPWHRSMYWLFFFGVAEGALLLLEFINDGYTWWEILTSTSLPDGVAYNNVLSGMLIGVMVAFPSKIILGAVSRFIKLPFPFSELAENIIEKPLEVELKHHAVPREINDLVNETHRYGKIGDHEKEHETALEAVRRCPKSAVAHNNLGCALGNLGRYDEAIEEFREAVRLIEVNRRLGIRMPDPYTEPIENLEKAIRARR
jgi:tetratricopeptide (TPR) repeat protein